MTPKLKIALIQFKPEPVNPRSNFEKAVNEIRTAVAQGGELIVLPEYHLTSWVPDHPDFITSYQNSVVYLSHYQELAKELNVHVVPGTIIVAVNSDTDDNVSSTKVELRNLSYFISASGEIISTYQKKNLWHPERKILSRAERGPHKSFDVPLSKHGSGNTTIRVGLLICWDLAFPEAFRELVADGADLIIIPAFWLIPDDNPAVVSLNKDSSKIFLDSVVVARAYENSCAIAFCNAHGQSQIAMPILGSLGRLDVDVEDIMINEVDFDVLKVAEGHYAIRPDLNNQHWHYPRGHNI